jgi:uncharacterized protein (TIGR02678 family)
MGGGFVTGDVATKARRHRRELADMFREQFGWQLIADDNGPVRLLCQPGAGHIARGLSIRSGRPFDPQRYALLFLVLASLEAAGARTTLTVLFAQVRDRGIDIDELDFDHNTAAHRRAFVHAVQAVVDLGVLELADGNEESFANSGTGDALYRVERTHLTRLLATSKPPSLATDADAAVSENLYTETEDGLVRQRRHRVTRALASEPVLYRSDLTTAEIDYLAGQEKRIRQLLDDWFGLTLETRAEGWVAVDAEQGMTDIMFPSISVPKATALAIIDASRNRRGVDDEATWTTAELHEFVAGLATTFGKAWPIEVEDSDGIAQTTDKAIDVLVGMCLARRAGDLLIALPAAGRFSLTASTPAPGNDAFAFNPEQPS